MSQSNTVLPGFGSIMSGGPPKSSGMMSMANSASIVAVANQGSYEETRPPISVVHILQKDSKVIFKIDLKNMISTSVKIRNQP